MDKLIKLVEKLLEEGNFIGDIIGLDHGVSSSALKAKLLEALTEAKVSQTVNKPDNVVEVVEITEGVVAELDGKYYHQYEYDRQSTIRGFGDIDKAKIAEAKYCPVATHMEYANGPCRDALSNAKLIPVTLTTTKTYVLG